ncbi:glycosyltransferase [Kaarinaea lacus]
MLSKEPNSSGSVVFVLPSLDAGGAERIIINVANGLSEGYDVYLGTIRRGGDLRDLVAKNVKNLFLKNKFAWLLILLWKARRIKPCCLVSTNFDINTILILFRWLLPANCALIIREPTPVYAANISSKYPLVRMLAYKYLYRLANRLIVLTDEMKNEFVELCPHLESKIIVINNGVNPERILNQHQDMPDTLPENYIVTVGRLVHEKGLDILIPAFKNIHSRFPECKLLIVGDGPQKKILENLIDQLGLSGHVKLLGYSRNPSALVRKARLFVLSSRCEGLSNAMLEALCLGVPVLAVKKYTGVNGIIKESQTGFLVDSCSVSSLADGLQRALEKDAEFDRKKIADWACKRFSRENLISAYNELFRNYCRRS